MYARGARLHQNYLQKTMEANLEWKETDRFVLYVELPTLQAMASNSVARAVLYSAISNLPSRLTRDVEVDKFHQDVEMKTEEQYDELLEYVRMPRSIEQLIKRSLHLVCRNLFECDRHFRGNPFLVIHFIESFNADNYVWLPNGNLDYEKTASKMLSNYDVSELQKFLILAELCREDEIQIFCMNSLPKSFDDLVNFDNDYLVFYWLRRRKGGLHRIPTARDGSHDRDKIDVTMARYCVFYRNWIAFVYFWNRLSTEDQIELAITAIHRTLWMFPCREKIVSMMSSLQQHRVLSKISLNIFNESYTVIFLESSRFIIWIWKYIKDTVTVEKFAGIVRYILARFVHDERLMGVLVEMWNSTSVHHRNHVVEIDNRNVLNRFLPHFQRTNLPHPSSFRFLHLFVSQKDANFRKKLIFENVSLFADHRGDPRPFDEFIRFCLPNPNDQVKFKRMVTDSKEMMESCNVILMESAYDILLPRLQFYLPNEAAVQNYVKKLIQTPATFWTCMTDDNKESKWHKFSTFVDTIYPDCLQAQRVKKSFVLSLASTLANTDSLVAHFPSNGALKIAELVLNDDELSSFKRQFANQLAKSFDGEVLESTGPCWLHPEWFINYVTWCCNEDENAIKAFQNNVLTVDVVTNVILNEERFKNKPKFISSKSRLLDGYLKWYMPNDQERNEYKMKRLPRGNE